MVKCNVTRGTSGYSEYKVVVYILSPVPFKRVLLEWIGDWIRSNWLKRWWDGLIVYDFCFSNETQH